MSRVTDKMMYNKGSAAVSHTRQKLAKAQEQSSSGKRINKPSDDPVGEMRVLGLKTTLARNQQLQKNITSAETILSVTESNLGDLSDLLVRAKELAVSMSNAVNQAPEVLASAKQEVDQILLRAVQVGNARVGDRYIFAGYQTGAPPFDREGNYFGDAGVTDIEVAPGQKVSMNLPGSIPFFGISEIPKPKSGEGPIGPNAPSISALDPSIRNPASVKEADSDATKPQEDKEAVPGQEKQGSSQLITGAREFQRIGVVQALKGFVEGLGTANKTLINEAIDNLDVAFKQVVTSRALVGSRMKSLDLTQASLEAAEVSNIKVTSETQDADALKVFSDLAKEENALNATLEVSNRLISKSLIDFLK